MSAPPTPERLGLRTPAEAPRDSELYRQLHRMRRKLSAVHAATLLVVDPSIGSGASQPGYALFRGAELQDYGTLQVGETGSHMVRLRELARCLREDFGGEKIDILVVEDIPPARVIRARGRVFKNHKVHIPLHRAVGAILATVQADEMLLVPPQTWHQYVDEDRYVKSDATDAVAMGFTVLQMTTYILQNPDRAPLGRAKKGRRKSNSGRRRESAG